MPLDDARSRLLAKMQWLEENFSLTVVDDMFSVPALGGRHISAKLNENLLFEQENTASYKPVYTNYSI